MWLCNTPLPDIQSELGVKVYSEGWLTGISNQLRKRHDIEMHYVFPQSLRKPIFKKEKNGIFFWGFYNNTPNEYDCSTERKSYIARIVNEIKPDIIHIFGTELAHSLECMQVVSNKSKIVISIQGLVSELAKVYTKKIPIYEQIIHSFDSNGILEQKYKFYRRGINEKRLLEQAVNVIGRTAWDKRCVKRIHPGCKYYYCSETLREPFYEGTWRINSIRRYSIYISQASYPIKGIHIFVEALNKILQKYPETVVYIAGDKAFLQGDHSYGKYVSKLINKYDLKNHLKFLGSLSAEKVKEKLLSVHIAVMPSLLENSPNSIGEAMMLGTPVVAADVGGIPSLVRNQKESLLYSGYSATDLAKCIEYIFDHDTVAEKLSENGRKRAIKLYDRDANMKQLMRIYEKMLTN